MAHCCYCNEPVDNDELFNVDGAIVRVCSICQEIHYDELNNEIVEQPEPKFEHHSFDTNKYWLDELNKIEIKEEK